MIIKQRLEEISDFEDSSSQFVDKNMSGSDRSGHHSKHNTDTEQSAGNENSNREEPSSIAVPVKHHLLNANGHQREVIKHDLVENAYNNQTMNLQHVRPSDDDPYWAQSSSYL
ncbi:hypothetical protein HHI36_011783 [Cryptolaemus montrouzieri]|uniref:Uncharacterized protein n=1 Tax=Cryptolaemus montrouzieri TaxID=559131 RepID=A0ABD2NCW5_9CUCU